MALAALSLRLFVGWVFLTSGIHKMVFHREFAYSLRSSHIPPFARSLALLVLPPTEGILGGCLIVGLEWRTAALMTGIATLAFSMLLVARGTAKDCGCGPLAGRRGLGSHLALNSAVIVASLVLVTVNSSYLGVMPRALLMQQQSAGAGGMSAGLIFAAVPLLLGLAGTSLWVFDNRTLIVASVRRRGAGRLIHDSRPLWKGGLME